MSKPGVRIEEIDGKVWAEHHRHRFERVGEYTVSCNYTYADGKPCMLRNVAVGTQLASWEFRIVMINPKTGEKHDA